MRQNFISCRNCEKRPKTNFENHQTNENNAKHYLISVSIRVQNDCTVIDHKTNNNYNTLLLRRCLEIS